MYLYSLYCSIFSCFLVARLQHSFTVRKTIEWANIARADPSLALFTSYAKCMQQCWKRWLNFLHNSHTAWARVSFTLHADGCLYTLRSQYSYTSCSTHKFKQWRGEFVLLFYLTSCLQASKCLKYKWKKETRTRTCRVVSIFEADVMWCTIFLLLKLLQQVYWHESQFFLNISDHTDHLQ